MKIKEVIEYLRSLKWEEGYYPNPVTGHNTKIENIIRRIKRYEQETYKKAWEELDNNYGHYRIEVVGQSKLISSIMNMILSKKT